MNLLLFHKGGIGDVVFGLPLIRDLKRAYPGSSLTVLTHRQGAELLSLSPHLDRVVSFGAMGERWSSGAALAALGEERFDVVVNAVRSLRAAWVLRALAPVRAGFAGGPEQLLYTHRAPVRPFEVVFTRRLQRLAAALGLATDESMPRLEVPAALREAARERLARQGWEEGRPLVLAHIGGGWPTKQWPAEHLAALARRLEERHRAQLLLQGGASDRARAEAVRDAAPNVLASLGTSLSEAVAEAVWCRAAVGLDSGLSHAAAAAGVPTVFLFGPNDERSILLAERQRLLTVALPCRPCNRAGKRACPHGHHRCMRELSPEQVAEALAGWLGAATSAPGPR